MRNGRAEAHLAALLRSATSHSIMATDVDGLITVFNAGAEKMFGWTADEMVGRQTPAVLHDPAELASRAADLGVTAGFEVLIQPTRADAADTRDWTYIAKSGQRLTVSLTITGVHDDAGNLMGYIGMATDVTESRRAERERQHMINALAESEESFRTAFDHAPIGIGLSSVTENHRDRFIKVNGALARLLGYPQEDVEGRLVTEFTHPDDRHIVMRPVHAQGGAGRLEKRFIHASGRVIWVDVCYSLVRDHAGEPSYFITQVEDIGTRKESDRALLAALEQQNHAARNLRKIDEVRTEMVATISHELRTPLTSIRGYLEILADGDVGELTPEQAALVDTVAAGTQRLADLADDLLALAKLDATSSDDIDDSALIVDLGSLARAALDAVTPLMVAKHQVLTVDLSDAIVPVSGDSHQLDRALINLLSNASKYTGDGGHIEVTVHAGGGEAHFVVSDDGIGIPKHEQEKLFERFFRASAAEELAIKGTGLGLAIVKSIVDRHGGRIKVESQPGTGSTFTITLPTVAPVSAGYR